MNVCKIRNKRVEAFLQMNVAIRKYNVSTFPAACSGPGLRCFYA